MTARMTPAHIVAWLPWLAAEAILVAAEVALWPDGGLWLLVVWTAVLLFFRGLVSMTAARGGRLFVDALLAGFCLVTAWEGGWLLLPAVAGFVACDLAGLRIRLPSIPHDPRGDALRIATASTATGWAGIALAASGPMYASASTTIYADGTTVSSHSDAPLVAAGADPRVVAVLALAGALFALATVIAAMRVRSGFDRDGRGFTATAAALASVAIVGIPAIGAWLVPGAGLAALAALVARDAVPGIRRRAMPSP